MRRSFRIALAATCLLCICGQQSFSASFNAPPLKSLDLQIYRDPFNESAGVMRGNFKQFLDESNFDSLEALEKTCRADKQESPSGYTALDIFYDSFNRFARTEVEYKTLREKVGAWRNAKPNSEAATLAEAFLWLDYAWLARGHGYANTVSEQGWQRMRNRIETAKSLLDSIPKDKRNASWYVCMQRLAQNLQWSEEEHKALFEEATRKFPGYTYIYFRQAIDDLPRWGGSEELWVKLANGSSAKIGGLRGDALYARIVNLIVCDWGESDFSSVDRAKLHKGFEALRKLYPKNPSIDAIEVKLALAMNDRILARKIFNDIGPVVDICEWGSKRDFINMRERAFSNNDH